VLEKLPVGDATSVSDALAHSFAPWVRDRGRAYFSRGAVRLLRGEEALVEAAVQGSQRYAVRLWVRKDDLGVSCTCPFFAREFEGCKHIWATLLAVEHEATHGGAAPGFPSGAPPDRRMRQGGFERDLWRERLNALAAAPGDPARERAPKGPLAEIDYWIDLPGTSAEAALVVELVQRTRKANGEWGRAQPFRLTAERIERTRDERDARALALLRGADGADAYRSWERAGDRCLVKGGLARLLVAEIAATGRGLVRTAVDEPQGRPLAWEPEPWVFALAVQPHREEYRISGVLRRSSDERALDDATLLPEAGLVFFGAVAAPLDTGSRSDWISDLRAQGAVRVPRKHVHEALRSVLTLGLERVALPPELSPEQLELRPLPRLRIRSGSPHWAGGRLECELSFDYGGAVVRWDDRDDLVWVGERQVAPRVRECEERAAARLRDMGGRVQHPVGQRARFELAPSRLPKAVRVLAGEGWRVEAEGRLYRPARKLSLEVRSGIDWFDLEGEVDFGGEKASLPQVLEAIRRRESLVVLSGGGGGILPEEWLEQYRLLAQLGAASDGALRFSKAQASLLDALLADQPQLRADAVFERARERLRSFAGVAPEDAAPGFEGRLRGYQREGLGWLRFLREFGFGGCLADDMGLGKTVQVLALLETRRAETPRSERRPSLVVVPRSLVFNWKQEAARFAPLLRVLDHSGLARRKRSESFEDYDVVLVTYGVLRRDIGELVKQRFDYVVLDEAQAVKNDATGASKAARLLRAEHRLALSGTPIENHLGELQSLFEFLNPGLLGKRALEVRAASDTERATLSRALRPFILRRTKQQVAPDLPERVEQTIHCELEAAQRRLYDELRAHYQSALLARVRRDGLSRSRMFVLEALLRLRQAACHPALLDAARAHEPSGKLEALLPQLAEVVEEGHKALVFSQFTSFLALVKPRLEERGIAYEYLDGKTKDRAKRVRRFQEDAACPVFLISLKAGGLGLNLTAAEYVFILDPWWNPAVEAQAVDRAHRIGQSRHVFAYRFVARDTIEEKVLALQERKRRLADLILGAGEGPLRDLSLEDLELLLSA
jgi:superfamily II DNA or RNA helicase